MNKEIHFANRSIRMEYSGEHSTNLVDFLFSAMPSRGEALPHAVFSLRNRSSSDEVSLEIAYMKNNNVPPPPGVRRPRSIRGPASKLVPGILHEVDFELADRVSEGLYLHAACAAREGRAVIMPAASGCGKSTLTCWLARHGFRYMSDESTFIPLQSIDCFGFTRPAHIKGESREIFKDIASDDILEFEGPADPNLQWLVSPSVLNPLEKSAPVPVKAIIFPTFQSGSRLQSEQLSAANTVFEVARCLVNARNLPENGFLEMQRLAKAVPAWQIVYGDLREAQEFFDDICKNSILG